MVRRQRGVSLLSVLFRTMLSLGSKPPHFIRNLNHPEEIRKGYLGWLEAASAESEVDKDVELLRRLDDHLDISGLFQTKLEPVQRRCGEGLSTET